MFHTCLWSRRHLPNPARDQTYETACRAKLVFYYQRFNSRAERKAMASDVVSFGETMLRLSPPSGVRLEEASTLHVYVAGTESNTLACLSRLHLRTIWVSAL